MITSSAHAMTPELTRSLTEFATSLANQRKTAAAQSKEADAPSRSEYASRFGDQQEVRRDAARQATVFAVALQSEKSQTEALLATVEPDSEDDDGHSSTTQSEAMAPAKIYKGSMSYQRRTDLVAAFEKAAQQTDDRPRINLLV